MKVVEAGKMELEDAVVWANVALDTAVQREGFRNIQCSLTEAIQTLIRHAEYANRQAASFETCKQKEDAAMIEQFESLIECIESGDTESATDWLRAAIRKLEERKYEAKL